MADEEIRADAKLKNLPEGKLDELWLLRHPVDGGKRKKIREIKALLPKQFGLSASISTISGFYRWLRQKRETEQSMEAAEQAKLEFLKENPDASPEALHSLAQMVFTNKAMQQGDVKAWAKVAGIWERKKAREFNEKKFQAAIKSKLETGLDALFEEIKGNERAEKIFKQLKDVLDES